MNNKQPILVVDIGNTSTSLGVFQNGKIGRIGRIEKNVQTLPSVSRQIRQTVGTKKLAGVCIASVVPALNSIWKLAIHDEFKLEPMWVNHRVNLGVSITYPKPATIGADRLANAAGGVIRYGAPIIIADFGTAVTFDLVTRQDGYIGGIIAPGLPLMFDYLAERTAQLPKVSWRPVRHTVGKSTEEAMQLGAHWGYRGMVREIMQELRKEPALRQAVICSTGGFAEKVLKGLKPEPILDPTLTLFGVGCIYWMNQPKTTGRG